MRLFEQTTNAQTSVPAVLLQTAVRPSVPLPDGANAHPSASAPRVIVQRYGSLDRQTQAMCLSSRAGYRTVLIILRRTRLRLSRATDIVHDGVALAGHVYVSRDGIDDHCLFQGPYDALHLRLSTDLFDDDCAVGFNDDQTGHQYFQDAIIERLGVALLAADHSLTLHGRIYAESIGAAIVARISANGEPNDDARPRGTVNALAKWRLKRTLEYIEANLSEPIGLAEIAAAAGLTRMHFAAQFRAATGLRPHEYLLRRRIEQAQELLLSPEAALVDVALDVGFQTQAHFTSVFRRFVGQPPHAWRQAQRADACSNSRSGGIT